MEHDAGEVKQRTLNDVNSVTNTLNCTVCSKHVTKSRGWRKRI